MLARRPVPQLRQRSCTKSVVLSCLQSFGDFGATRAAQEGDSPQGSSPNNSFSSGSCRTSGAGEKAASFGHALASRVRDGKE